MTDDRVTQHYSRGSLADTITAALARLGLDLERLDPDELAPIDEFHMGGREATLHLIAQLPLSPGDRLLDIGSGIGGPARLFARETGCRVEGVDLTPEFVEVARLLTRLTRLEDRAAFRVGSATALPFEDGSFEAATLIHVGMNVADKAALAREAFRVLRPGGRFLLYEVMRDRPGTLALPMPWASEAAASHVATPADYRAACEAAGFLLEAEQDRRAEAKAFFARMQQRMATGEPPVLSLGQLLGEERKAAFPNVIAALNADLIAPVEMLWRKA